MRPAVGTVRFRLTNTSGAPRHVITGVQGYVLDLTIEGTRYAVNSIYATLCGGDGTHDDPTYDVHYVGPGDSIEYVWGRRTGGAAEYVRDEQLGCTRILPVKSGTYTARACLLTDAPARPNVDTSRLPKTCATTAFDVPASGESLVVISIGESSDGG